MTATIKKDTIISRTINEVFPDYESVIPTDNEKILKTDKKTLLGAIRRVSIFSNKSTHQVAFNISKESLIVHTEDPESSSRAKEEIIGEYEGDDLIIGGDHLNVIHIFFATAQFRLYPIQRRFFRIQFGDNSLTDGV